jgi:hypothetical protein
VQFARFSQFFDSLWSGEGIHKVLASDSEPALFTLQEVFDTLRLGEREQTGRGHSAGALRDCSIGVKT